MAVRKVELRLLQRMRAELFSDMKRAAIMLEIRDALTAALLLPWNCRFRCSALCIGCCSTERMLQKKGRAAQPVQVCDRPFCLTVLALNYKPIFICNDSILSAAARRPEHPTGHDCKVKSWHHTSANSPLSARSSF